MVVTIFRVLAALLKYNQQQQSRLLGLLGSKEGVAEHPKSGT